MMTQGQRGETQKKFEKAFGRDAVENCPVCRKKDHHSCIVRHLMNSRRDPDHQRFIVEQDDRILCLYDDMSDDTFSIYAIAFATGIFCSATYVRKVLTQYRPDWKKRACRKRSIDTSKQYEDGRRRKSTQFCNGLWEASRDLGTGCYMDCDKWDAIVNAFRSDDKIKDIARVVGCKAETVTRIWREKFGEKACAVRLDRTWRFRKPDKETKRQIISLFESDESANDIAHTFGTHPHHVATIWKKAYSPKAYKQRVFKMRKLGILKSLKIMGSMAVSGSRPEQACFDMLSKMCCVEVIHHDTEILPPYEIDITVPQWKTVICWDGPIHRRPIFGQKKLARVMRRDTDKRKTLLQMGWTVVVVEDECKKFRYFDMKAVASAVINVAAKGGLKTITINSKGCM